MSTIKGPLMRLILTVAHIGLTEDGVDIYSEYAV